VSASASVNMSRLAELIRDHIRSKGPVSFAWFMEQALYHPEFGYYCSARKRIGREGDYFTNVSVGKAYGEILAGQLVEMWEILGRPEPFLIVEQGAEDGQLAADILEALRTSYDELFRCALYRVVEPIACKREEQRARLEPLAEVSWVDQLSELEPITGVFFSNELLDALPVHLVEYWGDEWHELLVRDADDGFEFLRSSDLNSDLRKALQGVEVSAPYRTEVNLAASEWVRAVASKLANGFVLIVDYGYPKAEYYSPERREGTLTCYSKHRKSYEPLVRPGELDITAHVDFTAVAEAARRAGLSVAGFTDQHHFMVGAAEARLRQLERQIAMSAGSTLHADFVRNYRTLMHPGNLGLTFKFLLLSRHVDGGPSGFRYAREGAL
jgi:SAM-dependent MidA family methyltransferase